MRGRTMSQAVNADSSKAAAFGPGSLRLRLTVGVALTVVLAVSVGVVVDYRREYNAHLERVFASLEEQARALGVARKRIRTQLSFLEHVEEFCAQMNAHISPGHHILVLDSQGNVIASTRRHSGAAVEHALRQANPRERVLPVREHRLAHARVKEDDGATIIVGQYLDHIEGILRDQLLSRGVTAVVTAVMLMALLFLAIDLWVLRPLSRLSVAAEAWGARNFAARAEQLGPTDVRALAAEFNAMASHLQAHERKRVAEMELAREIQANLLPEAVPQAAGLAFAAAYRPAEQVAGDFYDIFSLPGGRVVIAIVDVAGHGISAALLTGVAKMSLHWRLGEYHNPARALERVNEDLIACLPEGRFVTACVGVWNTTDQTWTYASAGHPGGLVLSQAGVDRLGSTGPLLGVLGRATWEERRIPLRSGDRLFLYTDGLTEAGAPGNALSISGLQDILTGAGDVCLRDQVHRLMDQAVARADSARPDDVTIVAFEVLRSSRADGVADHAMPSEPEHDQVSYAF